MYPEKLSDPVLGDEGEIFGSGEWAWGSFTKEFVPTRSRVLILTDVIDGAIPQSQRDLYLEIEEWYPRGVQEVFEAILDEMKKEEFKELPSLEQIKNSFQLTIIDVRPSSRPEKCVLDYQVDPHQSDWYVVISEDYHVETCALKD